MRRILSVAMGAVLLGLAAIAVLVPRTESPAPSSPAASSPASPAPSAPAAMAAIADAAPPPGELRFRRVTPNTGGDQPEACLVFSSALNPSGAVRYADYVHLPDRLRPGFRVEGARLCLSGLSFGATHEITLRKGFPGAKGEILPEDTRVIVDFGDRPARVGFSSGFVLPRENAEGLPVTTVNVDTLDVEIHRVGDRLL